MTIPIDADLWFCGIAVLWDYRYENLQRHIAGRGGAPSEAKP